MYGKFNCLPNEVSNISNASLLIAYGVEGLKLVEFSLMGLLFDPNISGVDI